jgi:hypothetical protein
MRACHLLIGLVAVVLAGGAGAGPAHEHGVARLDVAVDPGRVVLALDTPLDNLLGFEHAPRNDAERQKAEAALARLRDGAKLFRIDPAAGCTLARVELISAALGLGKADAAGKDGHGDLEGQFEFRCTSGAMASFVEVRLFDAFAGFKRLDLQVATPRGQMKATLRRPQTRVALAR